MTVFDNTQAIREGWSIFHTSGTVDEGQWRIERDDEMEIFGDDEEAWQHVMMKAKEGSDYHKAAVEFIKAHNASEYRAIIAKFPGLTS